MPQVPSQRRPAPTPRALAYNLGNFMRTLVLPDAVEQWSLTTLREKLVKIGAKIVRHGRYIVFQMAEVAIPRDLFADILPPNRSAQNDAPPNMSKPPGWAAFSD